MYVEERHLGRVRYNPWYQASLGSLEMNPLGVKEQGTIVHAYYSWQKEWHRLSKVYVHLYHTGSGCQTWQSLIGSNISDSCGPQCIIILPEMRTYTAVHSRPREINIRQPTDRYFLREQNCWFDNSVSLVSRFVRQQNNRYDKDCRSINADNKRRHGFIKISFSSSLLFQTCWLIG